MNLIKLEICNFRSFRGEHGIEIQPIKNNGSSRPIVLFGGLNGAGKTTLFQAIKLALYGRSTLMDTHSLPKYTDFIRSCIHRYPSAILQPNTASVALEFQYGKLGERFVYKVLRSWEDKGGMIHETVKLWENEVEQTRLDKTSVQRVLNELIPPGISDLFFVDGEKIGRLSNDSKGDVLRNAFERLHGIDLVERLRTDLRSHVRRNALSSLSGSVDTQKLKREYEKLQQALAETRSKLYDIKNEILILESRKQLRETSLLEKGGTWGEENRNLQCEADRLSNFVQERKQALRDEIADIFPFCLAESTMQQLYSDIVQDFEVLIQKHTNGSMKDFITILRKELNDSGKAALDKVLTNWSSGVSEQPTVFDLSPRLLGKVEQIVNYDLSRSFNQCIQFVEEIEEGSEQLDLIEQKLSRSLDQDSLKGEIAEFVKLNEQIDELKNLLVSLNSNLKAQLDGAIRLAKSLSEHHRAAISHRDRAQSLEYAERTGQLLKTYRDQAVEKNVSDLETVFDDEFNLLSRKDRSKLKVKIDPISFRVQLSSKDRGEFSVSQLSEGEKHIYAVAMLVALAKTSQRSFPLIMDSPLMRLDSEHQTNLIRNYFPYASHQVILLSTDEEIDAEAFSALSEHINQSYLIDFNEEEQQSSIRRGYFL